MQNRPLLESGHRVVGKNGAYLTGPTVGLAMQLLATRTFCKVVAATCQYWEHNHLSPKFVVHVVLVIL